MNIEELKKFYNGFTIQGPVGNNAFSYTKRKNKKIYVPPLIEGSFKDLKIGDAVAFSEVFEEKEVNKPGLKNFIHWQEDGKDIFIFDNHNHAFFFWAWGVQKGKIKPAVPLLHVDQHRDMRPSDKEPAFTREAIDLRKAFEYTNDVLNVGNFIRPALDLGIFSNVEFIDSSASFEKFAESWVKEFILDIDMDIFSEDLRYIDEALKVKAIRNLIEQAKFITIATSPYFMDQEKAIEWIMRIL